MSSKNNRLIITILFLLFVLGGGLTLVFQKSILNSRANISSNSYSVALENSYLFASPLQAKADGQEQIRITAFLLDGRGLGVEGQLVELKLPTSVTLKTIQSTTDSSGKAIFDLSSSRPTQFELSASAGQKSLNQTLKIVFY